jgi:hypothetical protein
MRVLCPSLLSLVVLSWPALAPAADLSQMDRTIKKEPTYQATPKYCLLVFGPAATTKVWLVLDGDALYVDRNGTGDLTEPGERVTPTAFRNVVISVPQNPPPMERDFDIGDIVQADGKSRHTNLKVNHQRRGEQHGFAVSTLVNGNYEQKATIPFADKPGQAPIVWFNGPLTMRYYGEAPPLVRGQTMTRSFAVGTQGLGTFAVIRYDPIPANVFPVAEFEFPSQNPEVPPLRARVALDHRC